MPPTKPAKKALKVRRVALLDEELDNRVMNLIDAEAGPPLRLRNLQDVYTQAIEAFVTAIEGKRNGGKPYRQRPATETTRG